jgi:uncharacterized membrane protein
VSSFLRSLRWFIAVGTVAATLGAYGRLPAHVAVHWNGAGRADGFLPKAQGVVLLPFLMLAVLTIGEAITRRRASSPRSSETGVLVGWLVTCMVGIFAAAQVVVLSGALAWAPGPTTVLPLGMGALLVTHGNRLGKLPRNPTVGIRTPWTLADDEVWLRTHRVGARATVAAGFVLAACAFADVPAYAVVLVVLGLAAGLIVYSYWLHRTRLSR